MKQKQNNHKPGEGHKAKVAVVGKAITEIDGQKMEFHIDWSFEVTVEHIDYAIKLIAGRISEITSKISGDGMPTRKSEAVSA